MSRRLLGRTFDIHGGGLDLVFPHHENEIAQSECCHGQPMAKYWLHNGLMQASDEVGKVGGRNTRPGEGDLDAQQAGKISKSKGSSPFRELLQEFSPETIRFFLLATQYRRPIDYSVARLARGGDGPGDVLSLLQALRAGHRRELLRHSRGGTAGGGRFRPRRRSAVDRRRRAAQPLPRSDGRRFQHRRGDRRFVRSAPPAEQVRRRRKVGRPDSSGRPRRRLRFAAGRPCCGSWRRRWGCSASRPRKKRPRTTAWRAI